MSLAIRRKYFAKLINKVPFKVHKINDLMAEIELPKNYISEFQRNTINYLNASTQNINKKFISNEKKLLNFYEKNKSKIKNITPNGSIIPKIQNNLEFNILTKSYINLLKELNIKDNLNKIHFPFNLRIKLSKIKKEHMKRLHPTEMMHADGWTGADPSWVAIHFFLLGDISKNNILYAYPPNDFKESFLAPRKKNIQGKNIVKKYKIIKYTPKKGSLVFADNSIIHFTYRKKNSGTRVSLDTGIDLNNSELIRYKRSLKTFNVEKVRSKEEFSKDTILNIGEKYFPHFPDDIGFVRDNKNGFKLSSNLKMVKLK